MRCELCVRLMLSLLAPVFGTCEAVFARRNTKGPTGFVRDRAVATAEAEANEALSLSATRLGSRLRGSRLFVVRVIKKSGDFD